MILQNFLIDPERKQALRELAKVSDMTVSDVIRQLLPRAGVLRKMAQARRSLDRQITPLSYTLDRLKI